MYIKYTKTDRQIHKKSERQTTFSQIWHVQKIWDRPFGGETPAAIPTASNILKRGFTNIYNISDYPLIQYRHIEHVFERFGP